MIFIQYFLTFFLFSFSLRCALPEESSEIHEILRTNAVKAEIMFVFLLEHCGRWSKHCALQAYSEYPGDLCSHLPATKLLQHLVDKRCWNFTFTFGFIICFSSCFVSKISSVSVSILVVLIFSAPPAKFPTKTGGFLTSLVITVRNKLTTIVFNAVKTIQ